MRSAKPTLEGRHLSRSFGSGDAATHALRDVSLTLYGGEILLLMGPSGSGKSTLLAVLSGLLRPDDGEVLALGKNIWQLSEKEQLEFRLHHCGFIFQGFNLFPSLTAREQLEMVLRWGEGVSAREAGRRINETLGMLGMGRRGDLRADQLSGGEKQRVAIARSLIKNPNFCFADEPTSSLDWGHGQQVVDLLRHAAHERGATIFVVSHDARLKPYADRVCYLEDGCLRDSAPASQESKNP
jgi:putative ABC transport system ATP-binding protein